MIEGSATGLPTVTASWERPKAWRRVRGDCAKSSGDEKVYETERG